MAELFAVITPLLLVDVMNPVLFAALVFAGASDRPVANSTAMLLGHTLAYVLVGLVISLGVDKLSERLANPQPVDFIIELLLGLACLYAAYASGGGGASEEKSPEGALTAMKCLQFGAVINFIGAPFAIPYIAVIDQILQADFSLMPSVGILLAYNLAYALPFALVPVLIAVMGDGARPVLEKISGVMSKGADLLLPWMLVALGLFLLTDAATYFITGEPLPVG